MQVEQDEEAQMKARIESAEKLRRLGLAAALYANDNYKELPDTLQELKPYIRNEQDFNWFLDNAEYLGKGKIWQDHDAARVPIAYDKTLLEKANGTNVLFLDGHLQFLHSIDLKKFGINPEAEKMGAQVN